jgi:hypothetical protein
MMDDLKRMPVDSYEWSARTLRCFQENNVDTLDQVLTLRRGQCLSWPAFGTKSWNEVADFQRRVSQSPDNLDKTIRAAAQALNRLLETHTNYSVHIERDTRRVIVWKVL